MSSDFFKKFGVVYKATNLINNKIYIGQTTVTLSRRMSEHFQIKKKKGFSKAIEKYGKENFIFEEIYTAFDREELNRSEEYFIYLYDSTNNKKGYNLIASATYNSNGYKHSLEAKEKISKALKKRVYKPTSEETRRKQSEAKKGKKPNRIYVISEETKIKISKTLKEKHKNLEFKQKSCLHLKNPSKETREKMRLSKLGIKLSDEHKQKISRSLKGVKKTRMSNKKILKEKTNCNINHKMENDIL